MISKQQIDTLDKLQASENYGEGVRHIQVIVNFLRRGNIDLAKTLTLLRVIKLEVIQRLKHI